MQNSSTGMLATSVPLAVVPRPPRCPSWKIHTIAPNAALSERTSSANAFSGITTLPVSRNSSTNMITPISASTTGRVEVMASTLSRLIWAMPVNSTAAGAGTACNPSSWASERSVNSGAVLSTVRKALRTESPFSRPVGADGGPTRVPAANVPEGTDTAVTSRTRDSSAA